MDRIDVFDIKFDAGAAGKFSGYGAIFGNVDAYGDVIEKGAFKQTLREWEGKGKLPPMLAQHGMRSDGLPVGVWTLMEENTKGLKVDGLIDPLDTDEGKKLYAGLKNGSLDGLSIGYVAKEYVMGSKASEPRRTLKSIDLKEISLVTFPANDRARTTHVKAAETIKTIREFEDFLRDVGGYSRAAAKAIAVGGFKANPEPRDEDGDAETAALERLLATIKS